MKRKHFFIALLTLGVVVACNNEKSTKQTDETNNSTFIYHFHDASVPPQYHRSYQIKVMPSMALLTVDSYDSILLRDSATLTTDAYNNFSESIRKLNIQKKANEDPGGCTGGTSDELELFGGTKEEIKGTMYHCGGKDYGDLQGDVTAAANLFRNIVLRFQEKIDKTK
jgi:hypothetical protein